MHLVSGTILSQNVFSWLLNCFDSGIDMDPFILKDFLVSVPTCFSSFPFSSNSIPFNGWSALYGVNHFFKKIWVIEVCFFAE